MSRKKKFKSGVLYEENSKDHPVIDSLRNVFSIHFGDHLARLTDCALALRFLGNIPSVLERRT